MPSNLLIKIGVITISLLLKQRLLALQVSDGTFGITIIPKAHNKDKLALQHIYKMAVDMQLDL